MESILSHKPARVYAEQFDAPEPGVLLIFPYKDDLANVQLRLHQLSLELPNIPVSGLEGISRTVVNWGKDGESSLVSIAQSLQGNYIWL